MLSNARRDGRCKPACSDVGGIGPEQRKGKIGGRCFETSNAGGDIFNFVIAGNNAFGKSGGLHAGDA